MQHVNGADWKRLLEEVMAETDKAKLKQKTDDLEAAIFLRCQELEHSADGHAEKTAIKDATLSLLKVRVEKLGFPLDPEILKRVECSD
jgi:hypothetical protein